MFRNRKCYCMNNSYQNNSCELQDDILENKCDNVNSYENYDALVVLMKNIIFFLITQC